MSAVDLRRQAQAAGRAYGLDFGDLDPTLRRPALATWRGRMTNEYGSTAVFAALADQVATVDDDPEAVATLRGFAAEERRHGVLCGAVVEALGGQAVIEQPLPQAEEMPRHQDVPALEGVARNVISVCCLSETVAVSLITAERLAMPEGPLRRLLTDILSDEVGHARFGWRWLARHQEALGAEGLDRLRRWMPIALDHLEAYELAHLQPGPDLAGGHTVGLCDGEAAQGLFYETVSSVIRPRLDQLMGAPI